MTGIEGASLTRGVAPVTTVEALVLRTDRAGVQDVDVGLPGLQAVIGAERLTVITGPDWLACLDEAGLEKELDPNPFGFLLLHRLLRYADRVDTALRGRRRPPTGMPADMPAGTVVFLGAGPAGELTGVPEWVIETHQALTRLYAPINSVNHQGGTDGDDR